MKRLLVLAGLAAGLCGAGLGFNSPVRADYNGNDCSYSTVNGGVVGVHAGAGGMTGTANAEAGACADLPTPGGTFQGGAVGVGAGLGRGRDCTGTVPPGTLPGVYAVADGDNANNATAQLTGYIGVSNYEDGATGSRFGGGSGSNSGCDTGDDLGILPALPLPIVCGFSSGPDFANTPRDGCSIP